VLGNCTEYTLKYKTQKNRETTTKELTKLNWKKKKKFFQGCQQRVVAWLTDFNHSRTQPKRYFLHSKNEVSIS